MKEAQHFFSQMGLRLTKYGAKDRYFNFFFYLCTLEYI